MNSAKLTWRIPLRFHGVIKLASRCPRVAPKIIVIATISFLWCCDDSVVRTASEFVEVEIAPSKWLTVAIDHEVNVPGGEEAGQDPHYLSPSEALDELAHSDAKFPSADDSKELSRLSLQWRGNEVIWQGKEIPVTLREHDGLLYLIGFNREQAHIRLVRLAFLKLNSKGTGFDRINPGDFPRQIATQNMWMRADSRFVGTNDGLLDRWQQLRELDVDSMYFGSTLTARIWHQIENNTEEYTVGTIIPMKFVQEYSERYRPIALPTIVRKDK